MADPMTRDAMVEKLERVRSWVELRMVRHRETKAKRLADVESVIAALRAAPPADAGAPPALVALREKWDNYRLRYPNGWSQERQRIDEFVADLDTLLGTPAPPAAPLCPECGLDGECMVCAPPAEEAVAREIMTLLVPLVSDAGIVGRTYGWAEVLTIVRAAAAKLAGAPPALVALDDIAMSARRGLAFGHQATAQTPERMIERKEQALGRILDICERHGVTSSVLRGTPAPPAAPPAEDMEPLDEIDTSGYDYSGGGR